MFTRLGNYEAITNELEGGRGGRGMVSIGPCVLSYGKCRRKPVYGRRVTLTMKVGWVWPRDSS